MVGRVNIHHWILSPIQPLCSLIFQQHHHHHHAWREDPYNDRPIYNTLKQRLHMYRPNYRYFYLYTLGNHSRAPWSISTCYLFELMQVLDLLITFTFINSDIFFQFLWPLVDKIAIWKQILHLLSKHVSWTGLRGGLRKTKTKTSKVSHLQETAPQIFHTASNWLTLGEGCIGFLINSFSCLNPCLVLFY